MRSATQELARFAVEVEFGRIPAEVVHEAKRVILDSIGCALAGTGTEKGKLSVGLSKRLGGAPESSIIGSGEKVSCQNAAFANGELMNAMDYDALLVPTIHVTPYVLPAPLALSEHKRASGQDLILAAVLGHEISTRITEALTSGAPAQPEGENDDRAPLSGFSHCIFGGVAGSGRLLKLDHTRMSHALGIAGHFCPVPTFEKWRETVPSAMTKFGSSGWLSSAEVTAALLAETGYTGDTTVLDGEYGFWKFYGFDSWDPSPILERLGQEWSLPNTKYKHYPCCGLLTNALDCFYSVIDNYGISPAEIERIDIFSSPEFAKPLWQNLDISTHVDAQFSAPYVIAMAAHHIAIGLEWQTTEQITSQRITDLMKKVNCHVHPRYEEITQHNLSNSISTVEVAARGEKFKEDRIYYGGDPSTEVDTTDELLISKFKSNASKVLGLNRADEVAEAIFRLEQVEDVGKFVEEFLI